MTARHTAWEDLRDQLIAAEATRDAKERARRKAAVRFATARLVHERRMQQDVNQHEFSRRSGIPQSIISDVESGEKSLTIPLLFRFARALGDQLPYSFIPSADEMP